MTPRPWSLLETFYELIGDIGGGRFATRPKLLIVIVDSFGSEGPHNPWEFLADAAIRFEWTVGPENYHSRSFQISKIKTQSHALGNNHVCKILPGTTLVLRGRRAFPTSPAVARSFSRVSIGICQRPSVRNRSRTSIARLTTQPD